MKCMTAIDLPDCQKGQSIFPQTSTGTQFSSVILGTVKRLENLDSLDKQVHFRESRLQVGRFHRSAAAYLEIESG